MPQLKSVSFTSPYDAEQQEIERRRALAQVLSQQAGQPLPTNRMAGRVAIPIHPLEGAAQLAKGLSGAYGQKQAGEEQKALSERVVSERQKAYAAALRAGEGSPAQYEDAAGNYAPQPAQQADPRRVYQQLAQSQDPMLAQLGMQGGLPPIPKQPEPFTLAPGATRFDPQGRQIAQAPANVPQQAPSNLDRLLRERASLPPGDPRIATYDNAIRKESETPRQISPTIVMPKPEKVPLGYRATTDGNLEAIPGGPADLKQQGALNQDSATLNMTQGALDRLAVAANEVLQSPGLGRITGLKGVIPNVPGFAGADTAAKLQTLKAQVGFNVLQEMRNASKTGGALGQITERELGYLQNALAALDTAQSEQQMQESLRKVIEYAQSAKGRLQEAFNLKHRRTTDGGASQPIPDEPPPGAVRPR